MRSYLSQREAFIASAAPGIDSARRLALMTDEALEGLARAAEHLVPVRTRWALIALGGYGSGALLPSSDIDLLVLSDAGASALKPFTEAVLYPLWDAGLTVGHQVRDKRDHIRALREDISILAASLTGRLIVGDRELASSVLASCARDARKRSRDVLRAISERERPGSPYLLEPDLKEGAGGRRDYDELVWTAATLTGMPQTTPAALVGLDLLSAEELALLETAAETTAAMRWALQRDGAGNLMTVESAEESGLDPAAVQRALADTAHLLVRARRATGGARPAKQAPADASRVLELALRGETSLAELEERAWSGDLEALVPGMRELMTLRRPGIGHTLTVGAHCLRTATLVGTIAGHTEAGTVASESAALIDDARPLVVAAMAHDVGKAQPGPDHALRGERPAREIAGRFGLPDHADRIAALVRHHLLLIETATRADIDDEDAVLRAAALLGDRGLLAPLHLLTVADSLATGPATWNEWTAALVGKLVTRLDAALSPDVDGAGLASSANAVRNAVLRDLPADDPRREFILGAPVRYLAGRDASQVLTHADLVMALAEERVPGAHAVRIDSGPVEGSFDVTIAVRDRHGLLATLSGVLALAGLDILSVEATATGSDVVLDTFTVRSATLAPLAAETWTRFDRLLDAALRDRLSIGVRLAERRRHYRMAHAGIGKMDVLPGDAYAATVRVRAADRVGLLYDIARAMADSGLEIRSVTATTRHDSVDDVFRVTDAMGGVPEEGLLGMLRMRLRELG